ncbi:50S ribosomal protein L21 [Candidatus Babeliales bacterium]|nr:50S ribosomal protein L21 [Candidatus Babeliales bacterium]
MTTNSDAEVKDTKIVNDTGQYVIFQTGGKQYQAVPGRTLAVEKLEGEAGDKLEFNEVLFVKKGEDQYEFGTPHVEGFTLKANIVKQDRGTKLVVFKMKKRKKYRVKKGHRQPHTVIRFEAF